MRTRWALALVLLPALAAPGCGGPKAPQPETDELEPLTIVQVEPFELERLDCGAAILMEASTGTVLFEQNADQRRAPASIVKMLLEVVVMDLVDRAELSLGDPIRASAWASKMGGSQVYLKEGEVFPLEELMKAIAISSANDACVAVAEHAAGSVDAFVDLMNRYAERLGLTETHYYNVHGLDDEPDQLNVTTAREVALMGREAVRHPDILRWSSMTREPFRDGEFILENTNTLVGRFQGLDGIKTGYTERAGYNLCASGERQGMRYISVVMGADTRTACASITSRLLTAAFQGVKVVRATEKGKPAAGSIVVGQSEATEIRPIARRDVWVLVPRFEGEEVRTVLSPTEPLLAPLVVGSPVGHARVMQGADLLAEVPIVSDRAVEAKGVKAWFRGVIGR